MKAFGIDFGEFPDWVSISAMIAILLWVIRKTEKEEEKVE